MDERDIQDRLYWGLNRAAKILGRPTDAYRSGDLSDPLLPGSRFLRLPAAFTHADGNFSKIVGYGQAAWRGYFDGAYTRVGDYLVQGADIWFIAAQSALLPILCIKTNKYLTVTRTAAPETGAAYGAGVQGTTATIISKWPASVLAATSGQKPPAGLPSDVTMSSWTALLPSKHGQLLQSSDVVSDENGTLGVILSAELSDLGWRLAVRQVST